MRRVLMLGAALAMSIVVIGPVASATENHDGGFSKSITTEMSSKKKAKSVSVKIGDKNFKCMWTPYGGTICDQVPICNYFGCTYVVR